MIDVGHTCPDIHDWIQSAYTKIHPMKHPQLPGAAPISRLLRALARTYGHCMLFRFCFLEDANVCWPNKVFAVDGTSIAVYQPDDGLRKWDLSIGLP